MSEKFTVTPMSETLELKPGETYEGYILISNPEDSEGDFDFQVEVAPYGVTGNDYKADLTTSSARTLLAEWVKVTNATGVVKPNEKVRVEYTITVPEDAAGGGQYAALVVSKNSHGEVENANIGVSNVYGMASILYARIDGEINRAGEVMENSIPGFTTSLPVSSSVMLKNDGNVHEDANIYISIKNMLNGETIYPKEGQSGGITEEILPGTTRYLAQSIQDISPLGIYEVKQTIQYLDHEDVATQVLIACPIWFMFLVFVTVCSIISFIISRIIKRKKSKE